MKTSLLQKIKTNKRTFIVSALVLPLLLSASAIVYAGTITPPIGAPTAKFYTISEIYNLITTNTPATEGTHSFTFSDSLTGTHHTLTEVYNSLASLISADKVKLGTTYLNTSGALVPSGGDATPANCLTGKTFFGASQTNWTLQTGTMPSNGSFALSCGASDQAVSAGYYTGGTLSGDADLASGNIKSGINIFGIDGTAYSGYPGTAWTGTPTITQALCDAQNANGWYWFSDGNSDGDISDPEDGLCVKATAGTAGSWNGDFFATQRDNTYIAAYTCSGSFPSGTVATYSGIDAAGAADNTWNNGDCALCQADCYDGQKDLPDQGGYVAPSEASTGANGPINPEVLKSWKGTRLPTSNDFYGFCGATSGDADSTAGDSAYHSSGASSVKTIGNYGGNSGRGANVAPNDEYVDLSNSGSWEWLSEQHSHRNARIAGTNACSNSLVNYVDTPFRFRAVFRP